MLAVEQPSVQPAAMALAEAERIAWNKSVLEERAKERKVKAATRRQAKALRNASRIGAPLAADACTLNDLASLPAERIEQFPTKIGILLTYPDLEAKKEELVSASFKRPWAYKAEKLLVCQRSGETTGKTGKGIPTDVSIAYYIKQRFGKHGVEVDMILPHEISKERLAENDINFFLIYDLLEAFHTDSTPNKKCYHAVKQVLESADNIYPPMGYQKLINSKIKYYRWLLKNKIDIVPTRTMTQRAIKKMGPKKAAEQILSIMRKEGWTKFVAKPVFGQESIDLKIFRVGQRALFTKYIHKVAKKYPGMIFQKFIPNFGNTKLSPEVRMYHIGDEYRYSIISTNQKVLTPAEEGGSFKNLPMDGLRKEAEHIMSKLPPLVVKGRELPKLLTRLDMGCYRDGEFRPFVNEIEFVPSLYIEDHSHVSDGWVAEQMVCISRTLIAGSNDMAHLAANNKPKYMH